MNIQGINGFYTALGSFGAKQSGGQRRMAAAAAANQRSLKISVNTTPKTTAADIGVHKDVVAAEPQHHKPSRKALALEDDFVRQILQFANSLELDELPDGQRLGNNIPRSAVFKTHTNKARISGQSCNNNPRRAG